MRLKNLTGAVVVGTGALVLGAIFGQPGSGRAAGTAAPTNKSAPTISGSPQEGQTLTATTGTWTGSPTSYGYAWSSCDQNGNSCAAIKGASAQTYKVGSQDVGHALRVTVTATNAGGSAKATSAPTAPIRAAVVNGCPSGTGAVQVASLTPPARLMIQQQGSTPSVLTRATTSIQLHFLVTACNGRPVQGADLFAVSIPYNEFTPEHATTGADGTVTVTESRLSGFPASRRQELLAVLARATKPGDPLLGGVSSRRVVSFPVSLG